MANPIASMTASELACAIESDPAFFAARFYFDCDRRCDLGFTASRSAFPEVSLTVNTLKRHQDAVPTYGVTNRLIGISDTGYVFWGTGQLGKGLEIIDFQTRRVLEVKTKSKFL